MFNKKETKEDVYYFNSGYGTFKFTWAEIYTILDCLLDRRYPGGFDRYTLEKLQFDAPDSWKPFIGRVISQLKRLDKVYRSNLETSQESEDQLNHILKDSRYRVDRLFGKW